MNDAKKALATRRENGGVADNSLADQIRKMENQFKLAMPKGAEAAQLVRDALTALRMTRNLAKCEHTSVMGGLMTCAQLGLRPGVLGHAWLLPFWSKKASKDAKGRDVPGHVAQLVIGYQGLIELAHRSDNVASIIARTVYENDEFEVDYGVADSLIHKPYRGPGSRGDATDYYAIVKFVNGGYAFWTMSQAEMEAHRDKHATAKNKEGRVFGPWVDHFEAMAHKTCVRMLAKYMPKSTELANALAADERVRVDLSPDVEPAEAAEYVEGEVLDDSPEANEDQAEVRPGETKESDWPEVAKPGSGRRNTEGES